MKVVTTEVELNGQVSQIKTAGCDCIRCEVDRVDEGKWRYRFVLSDKNGNVLEHVTPCRGMVLFETMEAAIAHMQNEAKRIAPIVSKRVEEVLSAVDGLEIKVSTPKQGFSLKNLFSH